MIGCSVRKCQKSGTFIEDKPVFTGMEGDTLQGKKGLTSRDILFVSAVRDDQRLYWSPNGN